MQDRFKFRVLLKYNQIMCDIDSYCFLQGLNKCVFHFTNGGQKTLKNDDFILMQCTGLKDKNGLNLLFESDIINTEGIKIGNCYENEYLLKDTTNFVIKGMGTKEWRNSEQEAIKRGCYYAE